MSAVKLVPYQGEHQLQAPPLPAPARHAATPSTETVAAPVARRASSTSSRSTSPSPTPSLRTATLSTRRGAASASPHRRRCPPLSPVIAAADIAAAAAATLNPRALTGRPALFGSGLSSALWRSRPAPPRAEPRARRRAARRSSASLCASRTCTAAGGRAATSRCWRCTTRCASEAWARASSAPPSSPCGRARARTHTHCTLRTPRTGPALATPSARLSRIWPSSSTVQR